jgi:hypothetical protein
MNASQALRRQVQAAQNTYLGKIVSIDNEWRGRHLTAAQALLQIQGAVASFAVESGLADWFELYARSLNQPVAYVAVAQDQLAA